MTHKSGFAVVAILLLLTLFLPTMTTAASFVQQAAAAAAVASTAAVASSSSALAASSSSSFYRQAPLIIKRLSENATLPKRGSDLAAGLDLCAAKALTIPAGERALVPTDLSLCCPPGTYGRIAPRSGLALKHGIDVGAGVIDADYRGPVGVILFNWGKNDFEIRQGDRIAQFILEQIVLPLVEECTGDLPETVRGDGGFGSTGVASKTTSSDIPAAKKQRTVSPTQEDEQKKE